MEDCASCKDLQIKIEELQEKYDLLYKAVDNSCYGIKIIVEELSGHL